MLVRPELCTTPSVLHGGAVMAFADTLGAMGTVLNLPEGAGTTTIESKTNFIGPARAGALVVGEATPLHRGRRTMVWQTKVSTAEGRLVAVVIQTQLVLTPYGRCYCRSGCLDRVRPLKWVLAYAGLSAAWRLGNGGEPGLDVAVAELVAAELVVG